MTEDTGARRDALLAAYDADLRTEAEMERALEVARIGPLWLGVFPGGRGFISYRDLEGADAPALVAAATAFLAERPQVHEAEWKTRSHDRAPGLHEALLAHGFTPGERESVMLGAAAALAVDLPLPDGVVLRRATTEEDVRRMCAMQDAVFGSPGHVEELLASLAADPAIECWIAEKDGEVLSAGRLHPVAGTAVAGIWGGATLPAWRGRGIYRALTAARARSALRGGRTLIHSDSTEHSRPILERYGFTKVTETTPYTWRRPTSRDDDPASRDDDPAP
ncbi:GNAT family N-acetyltransferase [Brachybacterium hainanense]|uniref:GNAT family N-acetyltransferase n=1 Tax=Brachybacterium hainanense TaxID=1541174 RepID=A0ABV6R886_9MICO